MEESMALEAMVAPKVSAKEDFQLEASVATVASEVSVAMVATAVSPREVFLSEAPAAMVA